MENVMLVDFKQKQSFVETDEIIDIVKRAKAYLDAGYPVNLRGPAGTGKTTLAMHLAHILNQPAVIIFGSEEVHSTDLVGGNLGYRKKVVIDNYIHSVLKTEETAEQQWVDGRLLTACKEGYILIYDEFSRTTPETNNILLSVLEERVLELPINLEEKRFINVHPDFKAIFTSNPEKYAGVYETQEALVDRMITINLKQWAKETEIKVVAAKTGLKDDAAARIVNIVRAYREKTEGNISIRGAIMLGKIVRELKIDVSESNEMFIKVCQDILGGRDSMSFSKKGNNTENMITPEIMKEIIAGAIPKQFKLENRTEKEN